MPSRLYNKRNHLSNLGAEVVLHQYCRGKYCLNLSPFALKIETFLRLAHIDYVVEVHSALDRKEKCPWISLGSEEISDSEKAIERLKKHFKVQTDEKINERRKNHLEVARIMAEDHMSWCIMMWRYCYDNSKTLMKSQNFPTALSKSFPAYMARVTRKRAKYHGIGRYTEEEIFQLCKKDLILLSNLLGDEPFFGGKQPCTADCALFGQLAQLRWNAPGSHYEALLSVACPNLQAYCDRMKSTLFPDWNSLLHPPLPSASVRTSTLSMESELIKTP